MSERLDLELLGETEEEEIGWKLLLNCLIENAEVRTGRTYTFLITTPLQQSSLEEGNHQLGEAFGPRRPMCKVPCLSCLSCPKTQGMARADALYGQNGRRGNSYGAWELGDDAETGRLKCHQADLSFSKKGYASMV